MLFLSDKDVRSVLDISKVIDCVEDSFRFHGNGECVMPQAQVLPIGEESLIMAISAYVKPLQIAGLKWVASFQYNLEKYGLPTHISTIFLNDAVKAVPLAVIDGNWITAARTGAVTAVGAKYLSKNNARKIGIIGAGVQARSNLEALNCVLDIDVVKVTSQRKESRNHFAREMGEKLGLKIFPVDSSDEATMDADVVVSAVPASYPFIRDKLAKKGILVITLGSHVQTDRVFPRRTDKIVVDDLEGFYPSGIGHFAEYVRKKLVKEENVYANLGEIVAGKKKGRISDEERIWFSHVGMAIHDVVVGYEAFKQASAKNVGTNVEEFF